MDANHRKAVELFWIFLTRFQCNRTEELAVLPTNRTQHFNKIDIIDFQASSSYNVKEKVFLNQRFQISLHVTAEFLLPRTHH